MSGSRSLWYGACDEGAWVVNWPQSCGLRGHVWLIVLLDEGIPHQELRRMNHAL